MDAGFRLGKIGVNLFYIFFKTTSRIEIQWFSLQPLMLSALRRYVVECFQFRRAKNRNLVRLCCLMGLLGHGMLMSPVALAQMAPQSGFWPGRLENAYRNLYRLYSIGDAACQAAAAGDGYTSSKYIVSPDYGPGCQETGPNGSWPYNPPTLTTWYQNWALPSGLVCPPGYPQSGDQCGNPGQLVPGLNKGSAPLCNCVGQPINPMAGNMYHVERDYTGLGAFPIVFERVYNSFGAGASAGPGSLCSGTSCPSWNAFRSVAGSAGADSSTPTLSGASTNSPIDFGWRHNYDRSLTTFSDAAITATLYRPDSKIRTFTQTAGVWTAGSGQRSTVLTQQVDSNGNTLGWTYVNEDDETEQYDPNGKLLSITNQAGLKQTLQYDSVTNLLSSVADPFGHQMLLTYTAGILTGITDPNGGTYTYAYTTDGLNNLASVTYPDGHSHQYVYENTQFFNALTGLIDENNNRFITWAYDNNGNATLSTLAGGVEQVNLTYPSLTSTVVTDAVGAVHTYSSQVINGIAKASAVKETCTGSSNCTRTRTTTYDANGNPQTSIDYNGNVTHYTYDLSRDLETQRIEGYGTTQARTIGTQWHPTYRLPLKVAQPNLITTFSYDPLGNLLTKTEQSTSDATGVQGFSAAAIGIARSWTYSYNASGQVLSKIGPRTDINDATSYTYDTMGNLLTVTNAAMQVTALSNYDANGRVGRIAAPNGVTTDLTYTPRGWLSSRVVTSGSVVETTVYAYDGVGQLVKVTLPDTSSIDYSYDEAHRLTSISDSLGNSIHYTLDLAGNRIGEQVADSGGTLAQQVSRVYDQLNRLQQQTGIVQ